MSKDKSHSDKTATAELRDKIDTAIIEVLESAEIISKPEERVVLVNELIEQFVSPAMIRRAAGATSQVTVTMSPDGGVSGAYSSKATNVLLNLRSAATVLPASLPALATFYKQQGISGDIGTAALGILYLFPLLKSMAELVKIALTQQAAAVLMVMWNTKRAEEETVGLDGLLAKVNEIFREYDWREINGEELASYLGTLEKINAIERANAYESIDIIDIEWRLKETFEIAR